MRTSSIWHAIESKSNLLSAFASARLGSPRLDLGLWQVQHENAGNNRLSVDIFLLFFLILNNMFKSSGSSSRWSGVAAFTLHINETQSLARTIYKAWIDVAATRASLLSTPPPFSLFWRAFVSFFWAARSRCWQITEVAVVKKSYEKFCAFINCCTRFKTRGRNACSPRQGQKAKLRAAIAQFNRCPRQIAATKQRKQLPLLLLLLLLNLQLWPTRCGTLCSTRVGLALSITNSQTTKPLINQDDNSQRIFPSSSPSNLTARRDVLSDGAAEVVSIDRCVDAGCWMWLSEANDVVC